MLCTKNYFSFPNIKDKSNLQMVQLTNRFLKTLNGQLIRNVKSSETGQLKKTEEVVI
jgi:hypothetical protein